MSFEDTLRATIAQEVEPLKKALEKMVPKQEDSGGLLTTEQAAAYLSCSSEYVRKLQNSGILSLVFLPGSKHRRVIRSEVEELIKVNTVRPKKKAVP